MYFPNDLNRPKQIMQPLHCRKCRVTLHDATLVESETGVCEGCAIDEYERMLQRREQAYLEAME